MSKKLIERLRNTTYYRLDPYEAADRIEQLQRRIEYLELCCDEGERQLAASQAREQQLRSALLIEALHWRTVTTKSEIKDEIETRFPSETAALEAMIEKAGEVMRKRCAYSMEDYLDDPILSGHGYANGAGEEIRALPAITLEDITK